MIAMVFVSFQVVQRFTETLHCHERKKKTFGVTPRAEVVRIAGVLCEANDSVLDYLVGQKHGTKGSVSQARHCRTPRHYLFDQWCSFIVQGWISCYR